jgi:outer membrane receptor protein involved in Fe transport
MPTAFPQGLTLLAAAAAAVCAQAAAADPVTAKTEAPIATVQVSSSTDKYDARKDDTATKIVVTSDEILKHGDTTLADVLKRQPGVTVSGGNAGRGGGEIRMRGLGNGYTQVLLNGEAAPPGFSLDSLTPEMVERIEIVRAATAEFSTQAIAGTINIVLKKQVKVAQRDVKASLAGAGNFISPALNVQFSDKDGPLSYSISGNANVGRFHQHSYQIDEGWSGAGEKTLERRGERYGEGHFMNLGLSPRVNYTLANGDTLTSQTFVNANRTIPHNATAWSATTGPLPQYPSDATAQFFENDFVRSDLNWVHKLGGGAKIDTKVGLNYARRVQDFHQLAYADQGDTLALDTLQPSNAYERGMTFTGKYSAPFAENHTLALGWDGGASRRAEARSQHDRPLPGYSGIDEDKTFSARLSRLAVYAQDEWNITPRWSVYAGVRWEGLRTESEGNDFDTMHNRSSVLSPLFQTLWKLPGTKADQVRFALTRTYKAPALDQMIPRRSTSTNNSPTTPDAQGNPDLRPELAWGLDASFEHFFGEGGMVSVSAFSRRIDDYTRRDVRQVGARWVNMPVNDGTAEAHGFEMEAKFPLQYFYKDGPAIDVRANLARNWSHVDSVPGPDNRLADQVPFSANFGLDWKASADLTVGGNFAFKTGGLQRVSDVSYTYATVKRDLDLYALFKLDPKHQVRVSVINALAQPFHNSSLFQANGTLLQNTQVFPVTALLRVAYEVKL